MKSFTRQPLTRTVATGLRAATKGKKLYSHQFKFTDLRELWLSDDERHVVCTHKKDDSWQYWQHTPDGGWELKSVHRFRRYAEQAALEAEVPEPQPDSGLYVVAQASPTSRPIRVRCTSTSGPPLLVDIFTKLGYAAGLEEVGESVELSR